MTTTTEQITNDQDYIDVRDVIARFEELEADDQLGVLTNTCIRDEFTQLKALLSDLEGNGGDEQWRGSWYPISLIRDTYFRTYAEELADDIGAINSEATWPNNHIDWEAAAEELQGDYTSTEFDGVTYWYR